MNVLIFKTLANLIKNKNYIQGHSIFCVLIYLIIHSLKNIVI